jgi:hypothetical protein
MQTLKEFYYYTLRNIIPADRYRAIIEMDDVIVINFDCLYERECTLRGTDQLIYLAHKIGKNKRFLFLSEDGANIQLSGAVNIISNIVDCFGLTKDTCAVVCREYIDIPNCTVVTAPSIPYWCKVLYPTINNINIPTGPFNKKFAVWFNRGTFYRFELAKHLYNHYKEDSYISYQERGMLADIKLKEYFDTVDIDTPIIYDHLWPNRQYTHDMIAGSGRKPYNDYFLEIVAETDILSTDWFTEKTVKNLYIGKPFILYSAVGSLKKLHSYGFKSFSPWIDESYDSIVNLYDRLEAIKREVDRIAGLDINKLQKAILPVLEHNRKIYESFVSR